MRVGIIAPPWVPVPPPAYGGTAIPMRSVSGRSRTWRGSIYRAIAHLDKAADLDRTACRAAAEDRFTTEEDRRMQGSLRPRGGRFAGGGSCR